MVENKDGYFVCEECEMFFLEFKRAKECEQFCKVNKNCHLGIIKRAVQG